MILQGTIQGRRRKSRQKNRWEDHVSEGADLKMSEALRKAENREGWRKSGRQITLGAPTVI